MANFVIKKDETKEPFDIEKVKNAVKTASEKAGLSSEKTEELVQKISNEILQLGEGKEEIATSEIKEVILSSLDQAEPSVSAAWRQYETDQKG